MLREEELWAVNQRALRIYRRLCGRTTADLNLSGRLFQVLTDGWSTADVIDVIDRIELIRRVLDPPKARPS